MDIKRAYGSLTMPPSRYLLTYAVPFVIAGGVIVGLLYFAAPILFEGIFGPILFSIPVYFFLLAAIYPYLIAERRKHEINRNIHFFVTHMGVLATSNIPRSDIMRMLSEKKEYGALAEETGKIFMLTEKWNMSLPEAARFVSKRCPSEIYADFLDRFAYSLESGEELESFLKNEQKVVMGEFASLYKQGLYSVESMKEMFSSMIMSAAFLLIFAVLVPIITGIDATFLMLGGTLAVFSIEVMFLYLTKARAPNDPIWADFDFETDLQRKIKRALPASFLGCILITLGLLQYTQWPVAIILACGLTPLLYTGYVVGKEEDKVKRRDDSYPAFVRSLGASAAARGGQLTEVIRHLKNHDFGPLTEDIQRLYQRLNLRADDAGAWQYFSAECGSNLIEKFSRMFIEGMQAGGKADQIGEIISDNFVGIITLRKSRYQTASAFRGMLYGLIAGFSFALFVAIGIVSMLKGIFERISVPDDTVLGGLFSFTVDIPLVTFLIIFILLGHAVASSMLVRIADGGNYFRSYTDLVGMFWVSAVVTVIAEKALASLL